MKLFQWKPLFVLASLAVLYVFYTAYGGSFSIDGITYHWEGGDAWRLPPPSDEALSNSKDILNQTFRYLSCGNQTYVFVSEDNRYVLKFFRFGHLKPWKWLDAFPDIPPIVHYRQYKRQSQEKRLKRLFQGHWLACTKDMENCGILFAHLHDTAFFDKKVTVIDRLGISREIDLDTTLFVLQKKATVARDMLKHLLLEGSISEVKQRISQIFTLYMSEYQQGIFDRDHNVIDNVAFTDDRAIRIDVGKLRYDPRMREKDAYVQDIQVKIIRRLDSWTKKYFPQMYPDIKDYIDEVFSDLCQ